MNRRFCSLSCLAVIALNGFAEAACAAQGAAAMISASRSEPALHAAPAAVPSSLPAAPAPKACHSPKRANPAASAAAACAGGCGREHGRSGAHACCCGKEGALAGRAGAPCITGIPCRTGESGGNGANLPPSVGLRFLIPASAEIAAPLGLSRIDILEETWRSVALEPPIQPPRPL